MARRNNSMPVIALMIGASWFFPIPTTAQRSDAVRKDRTTKPSDAVRDHPRYRQRFERHNPRDRFRYPRVFDLRTRVEPVGDGYRVVTPGYDEPRVERADRVYEEGYADDADAQHYRAHIKRLYAAYRSAMATGHEAFERGDYPSASREFLLAASLNQDDPASRICAGNAQTAVGAYESASRLVERALELQPRVVYMPLDLRAAYAKPGDFGRHLAALQQAAEQDLQDADAWFLLGYIRFFSNAPSAAADALQHAVELRPDRPTYARLLDLARARAGTSGHP